MLSKGRYCLARKMKIMCDCQDKHNIDLKPRFCYKPQMHKFDSSAKVRLFDFLSIQIKFDHTLYAFNKILSRETRPHQEKNCVIVKSTHSWRSTRCGQT